MVATCVTASVLLLAPMIQATAATSPTIKSANVSSYKGALVNRSSHTLYALSSEKGTKIRCRASCLSIWIPLLVTKATTKLSLGAGIHATTGFISRSKTMKQVTFNSYPLYTYSGDRGALDSNGQNIAADGGNWYLVRASAQTAAATLFKLSTSSGPTTTGSYGY